MHQSKSGKNKYMQLNKQEYNPGLLLNRAEELKKE